MAQDKGASTPSAAALDVVAERQRQISQEGWSAEHDDKHRDGDLALAAACYAAIGTGRAGAFEQRPWWDIWPWDSSWWKPGSDRRRQMVKAGALILAEIERLDRAVATPCAPTSPPANRGDAT